MHHTIAWRESIADIVANDITPVTDPIINVQNGHFVATKDWLLQYVYAGGAGITQARIITPAFRQITTPFIRPINLAIVPVDEPNMADYSMSPLRLRALEEIQMEIAQTTGGAAVVVAVAGMSPGPLGPQPVGDIYTLRGTGTTTLVAGAWTQVAVTWQDTLPNGTYAVVGAEFVGVTAVAGRLIFEDQIERPGGLGQSLTSGNGPALFRKGRLGIWGRFSTFRMPNVEFLGNAADTAQEVYLDLMRVG